MKRVSRHIKWMHEYMDGSPCIDDLKVNYVAHLNSNTVSNEATHFPLIRHLRISLNIRRFELSSDAKLLHSLVLETMKWNLKY